MFITASSVFDFDTAQAVCYLRLFGKHNPQKRVRTWSIFFLVMAAIILAEIVLLGSQWNMWALLALSLFVPLGLGWLYKTMPKTQYEKFGDMKDTETRYLFGPERFIMTAQVEDFQNQHPVEYTDLTSVYESDRYLFMYHRKNVMYIADKRTIAPDALPKLQNLLQGIVPKYVRCKY